jgi:hypothetical protein
MKSWNDFANEEPELAKTGRDLLFRARTGLGFLATIRKDGAPRLHPVSLVTHNGHLYVLIPPTSPKCADLARDGRYALQAFPSPGEESEEFYIAGCAQIVRDPATRQALITDTKILAGEDEVLFELMLDRVMHTRLEAPGTPKERPVHRKWRASKQT